MVTLIYHGGALGDFLTAFPMLKLYRKTTGGSIVLLGNPLFAPLAVSAGLIDEALDINSKIYTPLFSDNFDDRIVRLLSGFNRFLLFSHHDSPLVENITRFARHNVAVHPPFPPENMHIVDYHLSLLQQPAAGENPIFPEFDIPGYIVDKIKHLFSDENKSAVLCPGSGSPLKNWPFPRFVELSIRLKEQGFDIIWVGGPAEENFIFPQNDTVIRNPDLLTLAAILKNCGCYIGNDSGVTHLAAMTGCRTTALFGASDPYVWSPVGKNVRVIFKNRFCPPCHLKAKSSLDCGHRCMECITLEDVL